MRLAWRLPLPLTLTLSPRALGTNVDRLTGGWPEDRRGEGTLRTCVRITDDP
jgi:hypothetical protein